MCLLACLALIPSLRAAEQTGGFVKTADGVELYYVKLGGGAQTVILPARLFAFNDFRWLAERYTLISYDMRNRGRSAPVPDLAKVTIEADVKTSRRFDDTSTSNASVRSATPTWV
jgi:pimeloyl-ACP methyl ester carboxylesterase